MDLPRRYPYQPKWWALSLAVLLFGAIGIFMAYLAITNDRGLILEGFIRLGSGGASVFYWVIAALSFGMVLLGAVSVTFFLTSPQVLELDADAVTLPGTIYRRQPTRVAYHEIRGITETRVKGQRFLRLDVPGRRHTLSASAFPTRADYEAVRDYLISRAPGR